MKKKLLLLLISTISYFSTVGQSLTTTPTNFSADDEVTFRFDVSGNSQLEALDRAWVWVWAPDRQNANAPSNINPANSNPEATAPAELTKVGEAIWEITFVPTNLIDISAVDLGRMGILLKGNDWSNGQTGDFILNVQPPGFFIQIEAPTTNPFLADPGVSFEFRAITNEPAQIELYSGDVLLETANQATSLTANTSFAQEGSYQLIATALYQGEIKADTLAVVVSSANTAPLPAGVRPGINYNQTDASRATLCLIAPGKQKAFVIGDFNNWQLQPNYTMNQTPDGDHFWFELTGLEVGKEYIFQYLVDGIRIADPFTEKVSDPFDDQFISEEVYPGLIAYPSGKTTNRAAVLQTGQREYDWEVEDFQRPKQEELVIYELLVRDFSNQGTYRAVIDSLDYLQALGINAVELMPINEFEGNISWGYNPNFYFAPDKAYGPKNDLKRLIDECHKRGMAVLLDMVLNHSVGSSPLVRLYPQVDNAFHPGPDNPWYNEEENIPALSFGPVFNHESPYTQALVDSVNNYWLTEYKFDGFRFDLTKGFTNNFKGNNDPFGSLYDADRVRLLNRMADEIRKRVPDAYIIFEHLAENREEIEFATQDIMLWGNMNYNYRRLANGFNEGLEGAIYSARNWPRPTSLISYMESHDEQRMMYDAQNNGRSFAAYNIRNTETALNRMKLAAAFYFTLPGPKMIWQFGEIGYDIDIDFNGRTGPKPILWEYAQDQERKKLYGVYQALIHLSKEYAQAFNYGDLAYQLSGADKYIRVSDESLNLVVAGNFNINPRTVIPGFQNTGTWYDFFTGESFEVTDPGMEMRYEPGEFHLYVDRPVSFPEAGLVPFGLDVLTSVEDNERPGIKIFPNPATDRFSVKTPSLNDTRFEILNVMGSPMPVNVKLIGNNHVFSTVGFPNGIYFLKIQSAEKETVKKILLK